jgi:cobyrinic acid a,c-diamide synthase
VQPFKKGPDYIDPMWLAAAAGRPCHNLDFNTMGAEEIRATFARRTAGADLAVIEGNNGLYDGTDVEGSNSNAAMAKLLGAPVILVVDCAGMARGVAPLLIGYRAFDPEVAFAGVILNNVANPRHEGKLRAAIKRYCDIPVLGAVGRDGRTAHHRAPPGLVPTQESGVAAARLSAVADAVEKAIDLDVLLAVAGRAPVIGATATAGPAPRAPDVKIAVARDSAFGFYYEDDLEALRTAGAELVFFDTMNDAALPPIADGLFIGGGFPETHLAALSANASLKADIRGAIEEGLPAYAECGGLMYLARRIAWKGETGDMVGVIPADVMVHDKPARHGYVRLREPPRAVARRRTGTTAPMEIPAPEFHYSDRAPWKAMPSLPTMCCAPGHRRPPRRFSCSGTCWPLRPPAPHGGQSWARRFVEFVRACKRAAEGRKEAR